VVDGEVRDRRLKRMWFGPSADVKMKALQAAAELVAA
jgi:hypothetical protein